jgi:hypothetical protein
MDDYLDKDLFRALILFQAPFLGTVKFLGFKGLASHVMSTLYEFCSRHLIS